MLFDLDLRHFVDFERRDAFFWLIWWTPFEYRNDNRRTDVINGFWFVFASLSADAIIIRLDTCTTTEPVAQSRAAALEQLNTYDRSAKSVFTRKEY